MGLSATQRAWHKLRLCGEHKLIPVDARFMHSVRMALGGLELWRSGGKLSKEDKRQFSDKVNDIVSTADLDQIIARVKSIKNVEV